MSSSPPAATTSPEPTDPTTPATTEVPDTTEPPEPEVTAADLAGPGPYAVGVTTRTLPEGGLVEVWYPADASAAGGTVTYNVRDFLPPPVAALVPAEIDDTVTIDATRDATAAADGPYPIVLFSHGFSAFRLGSSNLAQHLASWGMVVASTDHPSRDLLNSLGGTAEGQPPAVDQLRSVRTYLTTLDADPVLGGALDNERVALAGHSAGGGTVVDMALDEGILGYASYASGLRDAAPDVPSLFMAGELDAVVPAVERTTAAFDAAPSPVVALGVRRRRTPRAHRPVCGRWGQQPDRPRRGGRARRLRRRPAACPRHGRLPGTEPAGDRGVARDQPGFDRVLPVGVRHRRRADRPRRVRRHPRRHRHQQVIVLLMVSDTMRYTITTDAAHLTRNG